MFVCKIYLYEERDESELRLQRAVRSVSVRSTTNDFVAWSFSRIVLTVKATSNLLVLKQLPKNFNSIEAISSELNYLKSDRPVNY